MRLRWLVAKRSATCLAQTLSSCPASVKPIEQVSTALRLASAMKATTAELSTPPERKAPSGTSATIREVTAARRRSTISSSSADADAELGLEKSTSHHL